MENRLPQELQQVIKNIMTEYGDYDWTWEQCGQKESAIVIGLTDPPLNGELRHSDYWDELSQDYKNIPERYENLLSVEAHYRDVDIAKFVVLAWSYLKECSNGSSK